MKKLLLIACLATLGSTLQIYPHEPETFRQIVKHHARVTTKMFVELAPLCAVAGAVCGGIKGAGVGLVVGAGLIGTVSGLHFSLDTSRFVSKKAVFVSKKTIAKFGKEYKPFKKRIGYDNFLRLSDNELNIA